MSTKYYECRRFGIVLIFFSMLAIVLGQTNVWTNAPPPVTPPGWTNNTPPPPAWYEAVVFTGDVAGVRTNLQLQNGVVSWPEMSAALRLAVSNSAVTGLTSATVYTGDVAGVSSNLQYVPGSISNADIAANAEIDPTKISGGVVSLSAATNMIWYASRLRSQALATNVATLGQFLVFSGASEWMPRSLSGDATLGATGALTILDGAVTWTKLNSNTVDAVLARDAELAAMSNSVQGLLDAKAGTAAVAAAQLQLDGLGRASTNDFTNGIWNAASLQGSSVGTNAPGNAAIQIYATSGAKYLPYPLSGDATMGTTGAVTISGGAVTWAKLNSNTVDAVLARDAELAAMSNSVQGLLDAKAGTAAVAAAQLQLDGLGRASTNDFTNGIWNAASLQGSSVGTNAPGNAAIQIYATSGAKYLPYPLSGDATMGTTGAVTISGGAITGPELAANSVVSSNITDGTITSLDIVNGGISNADLAIGSVNSANIINGTIAAVDLASDAVVISGLMNTNIATNAAIAASKISGTALTEMTLFGGAIEGTRSALYLLTNSVASTNIDDYTIMSQDLNTNVTDNIGAAVTKTNTVDQYTLSSLSVSGKVTAGASFSAARSGFVGSEIASNGTFAVGTNTDAAFWYHSLGLEWNSGTGGRFLLSDGSTALLVMSNRLPFVAGHSLWISYTNILNWTGSIKIAVGGWTNESVATTGSVSFWAHSVNDSNMVVTLSSTNGQGGIDDLSVKIGYGVHGGFSGNLGVGGDIAAVGASRAGSFLTTGSISGSISASNLLAGSTAPAINGVNITNVTAAATSGVPMIVAGGSNLIGNVRFSASTHISQTAYGTSDVQWVIGAGVVSGSLLSAGAVANTNLATDAVTGNKIADGTIGNVELAVNAVAGSNIVNGAVTGTKLGATNTPPAVAVRVLSTVDGGTNLYWKADDSSGGGGVTNLYDLNLVDLGTLTDNDVLKWDGNSWTNEADATGGGGGGDVTNEPSYDLQITWGSPRWPVAASNAIDMTARVASDTLSTHSTTAAEDCVMFSVCSVSNVLQGVTRGFWVSMQAGTRTNFAAYLRADQTTTGSFVFAFYNPSGTGTTLVGATGTVSAANTTTTLNIPTAGTFLTNIARGVQLHGDLTCYSATTNASNPRYQGIMGLKEQR